MFNNNIDEIISIRINKPQLIAQLRALQDNIIELWINPKNLRYITLKDRSTKVLTETKN